MLRTVKRNVRGFFRPRRFWRLKAYFQGKKWDSFWLYLLVGWHAPFDLFVMPRIREMEGFTLPPDVTSLIYKDLFCDLSTEPPFPVDVYTEEPPVRRRRFPRT